jgi:xanthine dehydrogenase YagT iron-sulfur-binding subunit
MARAGGKRRKGAVTRRVFLKGLGIGGGAIGAGLLAAEGTRPKMAGATGPAAILGPGPVPVSLNVNGSVRTARVEPRTTLLDVLRDRLDLTGTKKICDRGECGGCAVLSDGKPVYACMMLAVDARGRAITTIEGIAPKGGLHPVQQAFIDKDALQCGFCTPGFVVACKALLDRTPRPAIEDVRQALGGHICRCGAYPRIVEAVLAASGRNPSSVKS